MHVAAFVIGATVRRQQPVLPRRGCAQNAAHAVEGDSWIEFLGLLLLSYSFAGRRVRSQPVSASEGLEKCGHRRGRLIVARLVPCRQHAVDGGPGACMIRCGGAGAVRSATWHTERSSDELGDLYWA